MCPDVDVADPCTMDLNTVHGMLLDRGDDGLHLDGHFVSRQAMSWVSRRACLLTFGILFCLFMIPGRAWGSFGVVTGSV
jgi:hypothetical protein